MRGLVILLLALVAAASGRADREPDAGRRAPQRIVGGSLTNISEYPDMVALLFGTGANNHAQFCGGVILNNRSVLTAAHCPHGRAVNSWWRFRVGSTFANSGGVVLNTAQIIMHPQYNPSTEDNDIAIIRVSSSIIFSNVIKAANIASYVVADNQVVWATGWGAIQSGGPSSEQLRHVQIWTINQAECRRRYASEGAAITDNMLCSGWLDVGGRDQCQGDSGGPLYHNGNVVGVCSWGFGCADPYFPGVNARVSRFISWISQNA